MERRTFLNIIQKSSLGVVLTPGFTNSLIFDKTGNNYLISYLTTANTNNTETPNDRRVPFNWSAKCIKPGDSVLLTVKEKITKGKIWFRIFVAQEIWERKLIHVYLPASGEFLGSIDIRFSSVLVPYEIEIDKKYISKINQQGLKLTLESSTPFWYFGQPTSDDKQKDFVPQIISSKTKKGTIDAFLDCFLSAKSVQAFGWREGTVLDGLWQIYAEKRNPEALKAIHCHLDLFFDNQQNLIYENSRSHPNDNKINGIESTIPFATLVRIYPEHPILKIVLEGWKELEKKDGTIMDATTISAEGCYTIAYPMAVIGKSWDDEVLKKKALEQLKHRFVLINDNKLYLRYYTEGNYTYPNWARGAAWTLLGFVRTITELMNDIKDDEIINKFIEAVKIALSMQRSDGLWSCFMHNQKSLPDTSGSAGISAAILCGIRNGFLPETYRKKAEKCWIALGDYITPDGFIKGVAQDNRAGVQLQKSDYRVIAQMGMGMMAQLYAEL